MDRRIDGEVREFGISGLLYSSNVLLYDRQEDQSEESLWSQIELRAIAGPAAEKGLTMDLLSSTVTTWKKWKSEYPNTTVLSKNTGYDRDYASNPYNRYHQKEGLMKPVDQKRDVDRLDNKDWMVVVHAGERKKAYAIKDLRSLAGEDGTVEDRLGDRLIQFRTDSNSESIRVTYPEKDGNPPVAFMYWFSVSAQMPDIELFDPEEHSK